MCPLTCENKDGPPVICPLMCKIGCFCPSGMAEHNGGCVHPDNCPATTGESNTISSSSACFVHVFQMFMETRKTLAVKW